MNPYHKYVIHIKGGEVLYLDDKVQHVTQEYNFSLIPPKTNIDFFSVAIKQKLAQSPELIS